MAKFRVQYDDGPPLEIDAADRERAWDEYKARTKTEKRPTGVRRRPIAEARGEIQPPWIQCVSPHEFTGDAGKAKACKHCGILESEAPRGPDSSPDHEAGDVAG